MENTVNMNAVLDKKLDGWHSNDQNFVAPQELTVTITLSEYRELVGRDATRKAEIDKANNDKYERDTENKNLREEVARLKAEIYEMQNTARSTEKEEN